MIDFPARYLRNCGLLTALTTLSILAFSALPGAWGQDSPDSAQAPAGVKKPEAGSFDPYKYSLDVNAQAMMNFRVYTPERVRSTPKFDTVRALREQWKAREAQMRALPQATPAAAGKDAEKAPAPAETAAPAPAPETTKETQY